MTARSEKPETTRMFENDFIEKFSRVHPATPFVAYVPLLSWMAYRSVARGTGLLIIPLVVAGIFTWTLTEYLLHRYVFHWVSDTAWSKRVHFILHGVHHEYPNDKTRLVMPLGASIPMAILFYVVFRGIFGTYFGEPLYVGLGIGYLLYDGTHYAVHHFKQTTRIGKFLRKHHMVHHFADHEGGFGVSTPLWDLVFGTMPRKKAS
jgi:sterol desaturase/sphingolipid hydroxylase (fatty acid hydroxylase superfamily)